MVVSLKTAKDSLCPLMASHPQFKKTQGCDIPLLKSALNGTPCSKKGSCIVRQLLRKNGFGFMISKTNINEQEIKRTKLIFETALKMQK